MPQKTRYSPQMPKFSVTLIRSRPGDAITSAGFLVKQAKFRIQRVSEPNGRNYAYEGGSGGERFELRCRLITESEGVVVEFENPDTEPPSVAWKEKLVNKALEKVEGSILARDASGKE